MVAGESPYGTFGSNPTQPQRPTSKCVANPRQSSSPSAEGRYVL
jgi:hypothetical protein